VLRSPDGLMEAVESGRRPGGSRLEQAAGDLIDLYEAIPASADGEAKRLVALAQTAVIHVGCEGATAA
jgi:hypothetical protein